jgi:tRNA-splicing ligase RtcB (3'-phosphate/5'-hydroxy nucleic acid ligase)
MIPVSQIDEYRWEIPMDSIPGMRVPGIVYADEKMIRNPRNNDTLRQVAQVATLPGIVKASLAMPDFHYGYGFPIGGVMASSAEKGVISPGGVGFDINCGVRMLTTPLHIDQVKPLADRLVKRIFSVVPCGVGSAGKIKLKTGQLKTIITEGCRWTVDNGYGVKEDLVFIEDNGCLPGADPHSLSDRAYERGMNQLGTLGSGNHFIEIQGVTEIYDETAAACFGLKSGQVTVMIHSGSRGLGHQVCTDYLKIMANAVRAYNFHLPDRQLACAPVNSREGKKYLSALKGAANYAWSNRQCLTHWVRSVFDECFSGEISGNDLKLLYDVAHNIVKMESHIVDGRRMDLAVHRKGATRAFGPGNRNIPVSYRAIGQPVIIPGDMGTASYILCGTDLAMEETFGSACHGAGRNLSRKAARRAAKGRSIVSELNRKGISICAAGKGIIVEEMPDAYKNIDDVIRVMCGAGITTPVAKVIPLGVVKG